MSDVTVADGGGEPSSPPGDNSSLGDIIDRAFETVDGGTSGETPSSPGEGAALQQEDGASPALTPVERGPDGRFLPRNSEAQQEEAPQEEAAQPDPQEEPPARFSREAREAWAAAPEPVRAEIRRAIEEMEGGIEKWKSEASKWAGLEALEQRASEKGMNPGQVVQSYFELDRLLGENPLAGMDRICQSMGISLHEVAAQVLGYEPQQQVVEMETHLAQASQYIQQLEREVQTYRQQAEEQQTSSLQQQVNDFLGRHPDAEELKPYMGRALASGFAMDLDEAYRVAKRVFADEQAAPSQQPSRPAQTRKGRLSLSGAPAAGSHPAHDSPPPSTSDAVEHALRKVGL